MSSPKLEELAQEYNRLWWFADAPRIREANVALVALLEQAHREGAAEADADRTSWQESSMKAQRERYEQLIRAEAAEAHVRLMLAAGDKMALYNEQKLPWQVTKEWERSR